MYEARVQVRFDATHQLEMYDGQREPVHEHDWLVEAVFRGPQLDDIGVLIDFTLVEAVLHAIVDPLDHTNLNESALLAGANPTAEHLARCLFAELEARLSSPARLVGVLVGEAPGCFAGYWAPCAAEPLVPPPGSPRGNPQAPA